MWALIKSNNWIKEKEWRINQNCPNAKRGFQRILLETPICTCKHILLLELRNLHSIVKPSLEYNAVGFV